MMCLTAIISGDVRAITQGEIVVVKDESKREQVLALFFRAMDTTEIHAETSHTAFSFQRPAKGLAENGDSLILVVRPASRPRQPTWRVSGSIIQGRD